MTTPVDDFTGTHWAVLRHVTGTSTLEAKARNGLGLAANRLRLPVGVNTVMVTWAGASRITIQIRDESNAQYRTEIIWPVSPATTRQIVFQLPVETDGHDMVIMSVDASESDRSQGRVGVQVIPSNL